MAAAWFCRAPRRRGAPSRGRSLLSSGAAQCLSRIRFTFVFDGFAVKWSGNYFHIPSARFGEQYARMLLMLSMVVMYSISCPLITPFGRFFIVAGKNFLPKPRRPGLLCVQAPGGQAQPCLCLRQEQDQQENPQVCSGLEVRSGKVCKFCFYKGEFFLWMIQKLLQ